MKYSCRFIELLLVLEYLVTEFLLLLTIAMDQQYGDQDGGDGFGQQSGEQFGQTAQGFGGGQSTGLRQWGSSSFYSLKNVSTGMYLAAHPDGQLVAEDDTTGHHDVPWNIYSTSDGKSSARPSCPSQVT